MVDPTTEYWKIAHKAIREGYLTRDEAKMIARVGTRKQGYWARHVRDLKAILKRRGYVHPSGD